MPVKFRNPITIKTVTASEKVVRSIHLEGLDNNSDAFVVLDVVYKDADGRDVEVRQLRQPLYELVAQHPQLYALLKSASYAMAEDEHGGELE